MNLNRLHGRQLCFAIAVIAQFAILLSWAYPTEMLLANGTRIKLRLTGYDPHDYFRGSYLKLKFANDTALLCSTDVYDTIAAFEEKHIIMELDEEGFAVPAAISNTPTELSIKSKISPSDRHIKRWSDAEDAYLHSRDYAKIEYPFDKLWMNEDACPSAARVINKAIEQGRNVYAIVAVKDGEGCIVDVEVDGVKILDLVDRYKKHGISDYFPDHPDLMPQTTLYQ